MNSHLILSSCNLAYELHKDQTRRESGHPFFDAHLVPVAEMVQANGGDDLAIAAAYLHDAIEDIGPHTREQIVAISPDVLAIVEQLTERGDSWQEEKSGYVAGVAQMDQRALLVSICDKLTNARDFSDEWERGQFGKRPVQIIWFFEQLLDAYGKRDIALGGACKGLLWDLHARVGCMHELEG